MVSGPFYIRRYRSPASVALRLSVHRGADLCAWTEGRVEPRDPALRIKLNSSVSPTFSGGASELSVLVLPLGPRRNRLYRVPVLDELAIREAKEVIESGTHTGE